MRHCIAGIIISSILICCCTSGAQQLFLSGSSANSGREHLHPLYKEVERILSEKEPEKNRTRESMISRQPSAENAEEEPGLLKPGADLKILKKVRGLWQSQFLNMEINGMDAGDTNGDGYNEIVVAGRNDIWIFKKRASALEVVKHIKGRKSERIINLDLADLDNNGTDDIFVSAVHEGQPNSYIIKFREGDFVRVSDKVRLFLKVLVASGGQKVLLAQGPGNGRAFGQEVFIMDWDNGKYIKKRSMVLPKKINIYGSNLGDIDHDGEDDIIFIDDKGHLGATSMSGENMWKSDGGFSGPCRYFGFGSDKTSVGKSSRQVRRISVPPRILMLESDEDVSNEIIVCKNYSDLNKAEVHCLVWSGAGFEGCWKTKKTDGCIADCQVKDVDNDGRDELVVAVFNALLNAGKSTILIYNLKN